MGLWVGLCVAVFIILTVGVVGIYNHLVRLNHHCENSFSQIGVQLKRRSDLIPNLVECVKGYMAHERETLERVIAARNEAAKGRQQANQQPQNREAVESWLGAEGHLGRALGRLYMAMENYPQLKAIRTVADLTEQLASTESRIAFARQAHNDWVTTFNSFRQTFPQCLLAGLFGFPLNRELLELANAEQQERAPSVVLS
jgi:LemA protein